MQIARRCEQGFILMINIFRRPYGVVGAALKTGNAAIVAAAESHRERLLLKLQAHGLL